MTEWMGPGRVVALQPFSSASINGPPLRFVAMRGDGILYHSVITPPSVSLGSLGPNHLQVGVTQQLTSPSEVRRYADRLEFSSDMIRSHTSVNTAANT